MGAHGLQRALLFVIVAFFAIYTIVHYLSTRDVLTQCVATRNAAPSWNSEQNGPYICKQAATIPEDPSPSAEPTIAKIGKVTMLYGEWAKDKIHKAVLKTHEDHALVQGHSMHVLNRRIMHGLWSKLSYMLMLILEELTKPEDTRLQWLFWFDLDIVVMNPNIPLDIFLPPQDNFSHIHVVVTKDHNGLNTGSFFLQVNEWSVKYLIDTIALRGFKPELRLKYSDQSAQEIMTLDKKYLKNTMYVPQRWFNAYRGPRDSSEQLIMDQPIPDNTLLAGDLQLHFAGKKVKHLIPLYLDMAARSESAWRRPLNETQLEAEIAAFWNQARAGSLELKSEQKAAVPEQIVAPVVTTKKVDSREPALQSSSREGTDDEADGDEESKSSLEEPVVEGRTSLVDSDQNDGQADDAGDQR